MIEPVYAFPAGPYLQAALFCEYLLDEKDNVKSFIRVTDRIQVQAAGREVPDIMPEFEKDLTLVLMFKAGEAKGPVPIMLTLMRPSGLIDADPVWQGTIHFEGGTRGHSLNLRMRTRFKEPGPYWYSVYVESRLVTKVPFEIIYTTMRVTGQAPLEHP